MDREPTAEQLAEEEKQSNSFDDLDQLLAESVGLAAKRKLSTNKRGKHESDLLPFVPIEGDNWEEQFTCAIFVESTCRTCGKSQRVFSHFASFQRFTGRSAGKPTRWCKVLNRPQFLAKPRLFNVEVELCPACYGTHDAVPYNHTGECTQLNLFF